jgi:hypothetical protein
MIDSRGRLFGRLNVIDALAALFLVGLLPVAYATYLLFRPATPEITSVDRVPITREELRVAGGSAVTAKLKVRGSGFTPMLRARIGDTAALGFVFENPNSADVIVGDVAPGTHDLVLLDGVQEVARARDAFTIEAAPARRIRAAGHFIDLSEQQAGMFQTGAEYPDTNPRVRVLAVGEAQRGHARLHVNGRTSDVATVDRWERSAVIALLCDPRVVDANCTFGGIALEGINPVITLPTGDGQLRFAVAEVFPDAPPIAMTVSLRVSGGPELRVIAVGDRDDLLDERAATVTRVVDNSTASAMGATAHITLTLGADSSRDGYRYRGQVLQRGAQLMLMLPRTAIRGIVESIEPADGKPAS